MANLINVWLDTPTTAVTQVDTQTYTGATWTGGTTVTYTMTGENQATQQETYSVSTSEGLTSVRDGMLNVLQNSTQSLFQAVTWAGVSTNQITGTAKVAGVPFYLAATENDAAGGITDAHTTANVGRNDFNTGANWSQGSKPGANDIVIFNRGSYDVLYGLDQSSIDLQELRISKGFKGRIGNNLLGYYLLIDVSNTGTLSNPKLSFNGGGDAYWIKGVLDNVYVNGGGRFPDLLRIGGTIVDVFCNGECQGIVTVQDASALTNLYVSESPGTKVVIGLNVTGQTLHKCNSGIVIAKSGNSGTLDVKLSGTCDYTYHGDADEGHDEVDISGGIFRHNGSGTTATLSLDGGTWTILDSEAGTVTITNQVQVRGGRLLQQNSLSNVTFSGGIIRHGGEVQVDNAISVTQAKA